MTTVQNAPRAIETRIGTLEFTHDFANGYPTQKTVEKLYDERDFQRACQAYIWSLPAVSFASWQRGITKGLGARNGQIVSILSLEARRGILTANATTPYYLAFADLSAGPLVLRIPARGVQGGISDAWQSNVPDSEAPAKYLVLVFLPLASAIVIGAIVGTAGQLGDLVESLFKRDAGVKDSSALIPGHGGALDRFDSILLVSPCVYLYLHFTLFPT